MNPLARVDPLARLHIDRAEARSRQDPCANVCTVANVDEHGRPQARVLVLRDIEDELAIFVNTTSPKWSCLDDVNVVVWLPSISVQYRLTCTTSPIAETSVHESWHLRDDPPKRMDWYYTTVQAQSSRVGDRDYLLASLAALKLPEPLVAPSTAQGLFLRASFIDRLDLGQPNGVHDRRCFEWAHDAWQESVLVP